MSKGIRVLETSQSDMISSKVWRGRMRYQASTEGEALGFCMEEVNSLQIRKEPTCRMEVINNDFPAFGSFYQCQPSTDA